MARLTISVLDAGLLTLTIRQDVRRFSKDLAALSE